MIDLLELLVTDRVSKHLRSQVSAFWRWVAGGRQRPDANHAGSGGWRRVPFALVQKPENVSDFQCVAPQSWRECSGRADGSP